MERDELIQLCQDAVVHHNKWHNRDSYTAQLSIQSIYKGLTAGLLYTVEVAEERETIIVCFTRPIQRSMLADGLHLEISSREDYFNDRDPKYETEMFDGEGIDFDSSWTQSYMPTRKRLNEVGDGNDWY